MADSKALLAKNTAIYDKDWYNRIVYKKQLEPKLPEYLALSGPIINIYNDDLFDDDDISLIQIGKLPQEVYNFYSNFIESPECHIFLINIEHFQKIIKIQIQEYQYKDIIFTIPICYSKKFLPKTKNFKIKILCYLEIFDTNILSYYIEKYKVIEFEIEEFADSLYKGEQRLLENLILVIDDLNKNNKFFQYAENISSLEIAFKKLN